ncbi:PTS sugar transporter subunit IIB [Cryobacterium sp. 10S3]|uniref:PTS sugar transporter subunit IIB n=1 Tax=Cryobacterium sp. 10S3 TaxID=3048582 RepID=UPI002AC8E076|nr:PTS sugar transporter subunit IIB [Cryobacterium sp. 10S3]MEB0287493.1 PTS sugar transporter subunit IIB [Cryobacterium sp. 10S3]WPX13283.1 PTS sugar transporter subunit IIB [Cryobacterium sp. 10S3]
MKVMLLCNAGMSTSILVNSMMKFAQEGDGVEAYPVSEIEQHIADFEVILLGPQIKYKLDEVTKVATREGKPVGVIPMRVYGMMDGKVAMEQARTLLAS